MHMLKNMTKTRRRKAAKPSPRIKEARAIKIRLAEPYGSRCYVCQKKIGRGKGFSFHHLWYIEHDAHFADFKSSLEYNTHLERQIKDNPNRFVLLCRPHHYMTERLANLKPENLERLVETAKITKIYQQLFPRGKNA